MSWRRQSSRVLTDKSHRIHHEKRSEDKQPAETQKPTDEYFHRVGFFFVQVAA